MSKDRKHIDNNTEDISKDVHGNSEGRAVTSDRNNKPSAYAGSSRVRKGNSDTLDFGSGEDDILDIIKKRQASAASGEVIKAGADADDGANDDILEIISQRRTAAGMTEDAATDEEPETPASAVGTGIAETQDKAEGEPDTTETPDVVDGGPETTETPDMVDGEPETTETPDMVDGEPDTTETPDMVDCELDAAEITDVIDHADADSDIDVETVSDSEEDDEELSELEKELAKDFADNPNVLSGRKTLKKYGFKPYTRELQEEETRMLREARAAQEVDAGSPEVIRKMAKGSGNTKKNQAQGKAKTSMVDKNAGSAKSPKGRAQNTSSKNKAAAAGSGKSGKPKKQKRWIGFVRAFVRTIIVLVLIAVLAGAGYTAHVISHADTIHPKNIYNTLDVSTHIYDDKERLVDEIYYSENRQIVSFEQLPEDLTNAFIAVEDKTFWTHKGFNFRRIIGAILERFHGGRISGTSTITQQLARNVFLPEEKDVRSIKRKIVEMYYAYEIEQELSKEEIITAYLNTIYLGYGCYGVDTAAKTYFGVDVEKLTLEQCAALAALPQAPGSYALLTTEPGEDCVEYKNGVYINDTSAERRNMILNLMLQQGLITQEERDAAVKPLTEFINPGSTDSATTQSAFKDYLIETIKKDLMNEYGIEEDQAIKIIYTKGLNIYSTMDSQAQKTIIKAFKDKSAYPSATKKGAEVESAMVVTEVGTGEIKAMVGTRNVTGQMLFNRATNPRQPGSSIKPLTVYAPALQKSYEYQKEGKIFKFQDTGYDKQGKNGWGNYITVSSKVIDEPMKVNGETWPLNVTRTYSGNNTFRTAIQQSINTCAVKILAQVGLDYSMDTLLRFGITSVISDTSQPTNDHNLAALGLGAMSYGISPLEMSMAYATFPNGGVVNTPICYTKVEDSSGRTLLESHSEATKVFDEGVAWIMTDVLKGVVRNGIGYPAAISGEQVGGKTGTTNEKADIWFCGFTPNYAAALWIGTDENVPMDSMSEKAAALWGNTVSNIKRARGGEYRSMPDNVVRGWDGDYYIRGTVPPEPEPEPDEEEEDGKKGKKGKKGDSKAAAEAKASESAAASEGE